MDAGNQSTVTEFIFLGLSDDPFIQILLFPFFLVAYMTTVAGNLLLIIAVRTDRRLYTSMYTFLSFLSFVDICYSSTVVPKLLEDLLSSKKTISFAGCVTQFFFFLLLAQTEGTILALMAYDRYVAICNPLRYNVIMNTKVCLWMISMAFLYCCIQSSYSAYVVSYYTYCGPNTLNQYFCDGPSMMQLSCSDLSSANILKMVGSTLSFFIPLSLIIISYLRITITVMTMRLGKNKAFSTCVSHLVVVVLFYGSAIFIHAKAELSVTQTADKIVSVFYTMITPMVNPMIYSLRNKDVHRAAKRLVGAK